MSTLTIHSLDPEVEKKVREKARREKKSVSRVLKELVAESVGESKGKPSDLTSEFEEFLGIWSESDEREFKAATEDFE